MVNSSNPAINLPPEGQMAQARLFQERGWVMAQALAYLHLFHQEQKATGHFAARLDLIHKQIAQTGTYWQTAEELVYGAKVAWRNSSRCIGRLHWQHLIVRDLRHLSTAEEVFVALLEHLRQATNGGKIRSMISVFAPQAPGQAGIRIWNSQLIRYAGYKQPAGSIIGDPAQVELTKVIEHLGWPGGPGTPFDVLPLVIQMPGQSPRLFELPRDLVLEVPLHHPDYPWFAELGLKWHALPVISNMRLEIGGISYSAAPFNGWYMGTEVGARNLGDRMRYNLLPLIAQRMGLDIHSDRTLWKDRAIIELNVAVLYSFARAGVSMVDHHTASRQFIYHLQQEQQAGRSTAADWSWVVPPLSGSTTPVFHLPLKDELRTPNFFAQPSAWLQPDSAAVDKQSKNITFL
jgi:nitric-oxide synthase